MLIFAQEKDKRVIIFSPSDKIMQFSRKLNSIFSSLIFLISAIKERQLLFCQNCQENIQFAFYIFAKVKKLQQISMESKNESQDLKVVINSGLKGKSYYTHVAIKPPATVEKRNSVAIICVLDISGSMDCEATQGQSKQSDGFSRLDLVKHSVNTIIHSLQEGDYLGIVTFSTGARTDMKLTEMNKTGKDAALKIVKDMHTQGSTNLWDGIRHGLELSKNAICDSKNTYVVVLTDGEPNVHPPEGNLGAVQKYVAEHPLKCSMSIFGYGYQLDTKLLSSITQIGAGCYGYIPDCSMVGTIFVNFLSMALSSYNTLMNVQVQTKKGKFLSLNGVYKSQSHMGPVQYGQTRNILIEHQDLNESDEFATLRIFYGKNLRSEYDVDLTMKTEGNEASLNTQILRYKYINFLQTAYIEAEKGDIHTAMNQCNQLVKQMKKVYEETKDQYLQALIRDIDSPQQQQGQVSKALQKADWWKKWGKHYFPALKIAHFIQMCTNFKDPGLQKYTGLLFREIQNQIDTIFIQLAPPQPTIKKYDDQGNLRQVNNMANYYNQYGGCFGGNCLVKMGDNSLKKVKDIQKGDLVLSKNCKAKVQCVLVTQIKEEIDMVRFDNGLIITNYHPIIYKGEWKFPIDVKPSEKMFIDKYYNFVLENGHIMIVNDTECVTLGHGFKGPVIQHEYLGTEAILQDLKVITGWSRGQINLNKSMTKRDPVTNLIVKIQG